MTYLNPKTGGTIGYQETKGTTAEPFQVPMLWQSSSLSYVPMGADSSGNLLVTGSGGGGGTQYTDGATQATPTGTVALGKNPSNVLHSLSLDNSGNLNVNLAAGTISGGNAAAVAPGATASYVDVGGWTSGGNAVATSLANGLPIQPGTGVTWSATQSGTWSIGRTWTLSSGTDSVAASQSGTWTVQQGTPPWTVKPDGTSWTQTGTSANVNVTNASLSVTQGTIPWQVSGGIADGSTTGTPYGLPSLGWNPTTTAYHALRLDSSNNLLVNAAAGIVSIGSGGQSITMSAGLSSQSFTTGGAAFVVLQITGLGNCAGLYMQGTNDQVNFTNLFGTPYGSNSVTTIANAVGTYVFNTAGFSQYRVSVAGYVSGTQTCTTAPCIDNPSFAPGWVPSQPAYVAPVSFSAPQPIYLDDQNNQLDDNGLLLVNTNWDGSDVATQSQQLAQAAILQQIAAGVPITNPVTTVAVSNQPTGQAQELNGQIQRIADLMEAVLLELRTLNAVTASLGQSVPEDPDRIRSDMNLTLQ